jgi:hypothetical protein
MNDLVRAGLLFLLLGLFALIIPVLKTRHRIPAVLALQPMHQTRANDSDSHSIPPAVVEGAMGVDSILVGVGLWVKRWSATRVVQAGYLWFVGADGFRGAGSIYLQHRKNDPFDILKMAHPRRVLVSGSSLV